MLKRVIDSQQDYHLDRWSWIDKLVNNKTKEQIMYLILYQLEKNI